VLTSLSTSGSTEEDIGQGPGARMPWGRGRPSWPPRFELLSHNAINWPVSGNWAVQDQGAG
jgi:hypothetical protein